MQLAHRLHSGLMWEQAKHLHVASNIHFCAGVRLLLVSKTRHLHVHLHQLM
jgi:hypothetical protein